MDSTSKELYFEKLQELVEDEDKIVTVPYLANALGIPVQDSKMILSKYVEDQRKLKPERLAVTYVLTGPRNDGRGVAVFMLKEEDIQSKKRLLSEVVSEIVYSVQKSRSVDFNAISLVDWFDGEKKDVEKPLLGTVVGKNCTKRTIKFKKLPSPPPAKLTGRSFFAPKSEVTSTKKMETNVGLKPDPSGGKVNLFGKADDTKKQDTKNNERLSQSKPTAKSKGGLSSFFAKSATTTTSLSNGSSFISTKSDQSTVSSETERKNSVGVEEDLENAMEVDCEEEQETKKEESVQKAKKNTKRQRDKSGDKNSKRRKRIIERNESDSDDLFEEDVIGKSDEEPERVPSPVAKLPAPKNKKRKAVDKTYKDEDGFIVTKTEYIYETASEDENEAPPPPPKKAEKPNIKAVEKKNSASSENDVSPQKGGKGKKAKKNNMQNQPTLMNFFKKK